MRNQNFKINYNLKQHQATGKLTQIFLVTTINGERIRIYTRQRVEPMFWDSEHQRCKIAGRMSLRDKNRLDRINRQLQNIVNQVTLEDERLAALGVYLSGPVIRDIIRDERKGGGNARQEDPLECLKRIVEDYCLSVNRKGKRGIASTKVTYYTALSRLENFNRSRKRPVASFEEFDKKFFMDFTDYLHNYVFLRNGVKKHYTQNTIVNTLKVIKNLLHRAYDSEINMNDFFQRVQTPLSSDSSQNIYLTESEIRLLANLPLTEKHEQKVRDMFLIACYTALRISDMMQLNTAVIQKGVISLYQTKTQERVEIPILKEIAPLIERYAATGFPAINSRSSNLLIRELAKRCKIDEPIIRKEIRGGVSCVEAIPKYTLISFHTARRSCITNLYKRGYPVNYLMVLSGHKSIQAFQRYLKASSQELMSDFLHLLKKDKAI